MSVVSKRWAYGHQWVQVIEGQQPYYTRVPREPTVACQDEGDSWKNKVQAAALPSSGQAGPAAEKKPECHRRVRETFFDTELLAQPEAQDPFICSTPS